MFIVARPVRPVERTHPSVLPVEPLALLALFLMLSGCATSNRTATEPFPAARHPAQEPDAELSSSDVESLIRSIYADWAGTPHRLGGTTVRGVDCSGFVQRVYSGAFNLHLPRTTREQVDAGARVSRRDLRPGDLVFFKPPTRTRHVGIYLSNGEFAHASSSRGVMISELDEEYWDRAYWTSRRVLPDTSPVPALSAHASEADNEPISRERTDTDLETSGERRAGW